MTEREGGGRHSAESPTERIDPDAPGSSGSTSGTGSDPAAEQVDTGAEAATPPSGVPAAEASSYTVEDTDSPSPPSSTPSSTRSSTTEPALVGADGEEADGARARGRMRFQDPATTKPREPTLAEQRARREAQRRERAQRDAEAAAEERKRKIRKRVLVGGGVAVGVVALVAIVYAASQPDEVTAQCVGPNNVVVPDENCTNGVQQGGYYDSGGHFVPIFIGGFGNQYHYNYGSRSPVGTIAQGGSTAPPASGTSVRSGTSGSTLGTSGGSSGTVSRGGLGVGGSSSGTSGSSGSGSSGSGSGSSSGS